MENSESYAAIKKKIEQGEVMLSDLERLLDTRRSQERITPREHEALLELAWNKSIRNIPVS